MKTTVSFLSLIALGYLAIYTPILMVIGAKLVEIDAIHKEKVATERPFVEFINQNLEWNLDVR